MNTVRYDRTCDPEYVNSPLKQLFTKKSRAFGCLPATRDALQHTTRAVHQSVHFLGQ